MARLSIAARREDALVLRLLYAAGAILIAALVGMTAWASSFRVIAPELALRVAPWDALARTNRGGVRLMTDQSAAAFVAAADDARRSLQAEPVQANALRLAGSVLDQKGQTATALTLMTASERLSRRDALTQLWMIEYLSGTDDVAGVLRHYEIALTGSNEAVPILYPVLISASGEPGMSKDLRAFLARNGSREWRDTLLTEMITKSSTPSSTARLVLGVLTPTKSEDLAHYHEIVDRLVPMAELDLAFAAYAKATGTSVATAASLRDTAFTNRRSSRFPPFDWQYANETDRSAQPDVSAAQSYATLSASPTARGPMLRQFVRLSPGLYTLKLSALGSAPQAGSLSFVVGCAPTPSDARPATERYPITFVGLSATVDFNLEGPCAWRSIGIDFDGVRSDDPFAASIAKISLEPAKSGAN